MLALRIAFTTAVMALTVWALVAGVPLGALVVVLAAVWLRRTVERSRVHVLH